MDGELKKLSVELIQRGRYQPRKGFPSESLQELADSIRAQGVVQPIVVRPLEGGRYELIAGERRWRAAQLAGLHEIPAVVRAIEDDAAMAMALIENIQREDLNPIEEAEALKRLVDELGMTHQEVAEQVGRSRTAVSNLVRLLGLGETARTCVETGQIKETTARALLGLEEPQQSQLAQEIVDKGLTGAAVERRVRQLRVQAERPEAGRKDPNVAALEQELTEQVGNKVRLSNYDKGKGKIELEYYSDEELEGIIERLRNRPKGTQ